MKLPSFTVGLAPAAPLAAALVEATAAVLAPELAEGLAATLAAALVEATAAVLAAALALGATDGLAEAATLAGAVLTTGEGLVDAAEPPPHAASARLAAAASGIVHRKPRIRG
ncbi:MAG TPA: hypothetical protein VFS62_10990, partial [Chloroflexota bacterium]|nr:hypothetical protein [Chloroflexota bacterium]